MCAGYMRLGQVYPLTPLSTPPLPPSPGGRGGGGCRFAGIETYSTYYTCPWYTGTVARFREDS